MVSDVGQLAAKHVLSARHLFFFRFNFVIVLRLTANVYLEQSGGAFSRNIVFDLNIQISFIILLFLLAYIMRVTAVEGFTACY